MSLYLHQPDWTAECILNHIPFILPTDVTGVMMIPLMVTLTLGLLNIIVHISGSRDDNSVHYISPCNRILNLQKSLQLRDISRHCRGSLHHFYLGLYMLPSLAFSFHLSACFVQMVPFYKLIKSISLICIYHERYCRLSSLQHPGHLCWFFGLRFYIFHIHAQCSTCSLLSCFCSSKCAGIGFWIHLFIFLVDTRWFKYDRDWFVCKQAALRSSCATLREWSHNLHPPSCSG